MAQRVELKIEGLRQDQGRVRFEVFLRQLDLLHDVLKKTDLLVSRSRTARYRISALSYSSPARVVVEAIPRADDQATRVVDNFFAALTQIESGVAPDWMSDELLGDLKSFVGPLEKTFKSAELSNGNKSVPITRDLGNKLSALLSPSTVFCGSLKGMLDTINFHNDLNVFYLYPVVGPRKVKCHFDESKENDAYDAVRSYVEVSGNMKYRHGAPFPSEMEVSSILVLDQDNVPELADLLGAAPNATGSLSSAEFIRRIRDGWE